MNPVKKFFKAIVGSREYTVEMLCIEVFRWFVKRIRRKGKKEDQ